MSPSREFYFQESGEAEVLDKVWERLQYSAYEYQCRVRFPDGRGFYALVKISGDTRGGGRLDIPVVSTRFKRAASDNMLELQKMGNDDLWSQLGFEFGQDWNEFRFTSVGVVEKDSFTNYSYVLNRLDNKLLEPWRRENMLSEKHKQCSRCARGFTQVIETTFPGWNIDPVSW